MGHRGKSLATLKPACTVDTVKGISQVEVLSKSFFKNQAHSYQATHGRDRSVMISQSVSQQNSTK